MLEAARLGSVMEACRGACHLAVSSLAAARQAATLTDTLTAIPGEARSTRHRTTIETGAAHCQAVQPPGTPLRVTVPGAAGPA